jgi:hypothetical protein
MQYFSTLPKIVKSGSDGTSVLMTNLMARASIMPEFLKNPLIYYQYDIQEGDTPEIIAHKYYGDSYRFWIVLFVNQIIDPQWDWPMDSTTFNKFIQDKYQEFNPYSQIHHYEKTITQYDRNTQVTTIDKIVIDELAYDELLETNNTYTLPTGIVDITITKQEISYYNYELDLNESKRNIKLLNANYVDEIESQLKKLMA